MGSNELTDYNRVYALVPAAIGFVAAGLILVCTHRFGPGLSSDSANYISAARSLLAGNGLLMLDGTRYAAWPPLYPTLLAALKLCGLDYVLTARCVSAASFGLVVFLCGLWILRSTKSLLWATLCSVCILVSKPLFGMSCWAWSDPLFILLVTLFFFVLRWLLSRPTVRLALLLTLVTATACLTRYVGVVLIPVGIFLLLVGEAQTLRKRMVFAACLAAASLLPLALWLLRNQLVTGTLVGRRLPYDITLFRNIDLAGAIIASWIFPPQIAMNLTGWLVFCLFWILVAIIFLSSIRESRTSGQSWLDSSALMFVSFMVIYGTGIIASATSVVIEPLNDRYLAPLYVPAALLFWATLASTLSSRMKLAQSTERFHGKAATVILVAGIGIGVWLSAGANYVFARSDEALTQGAGGVSHLRWRKSETIAWLRTHQLQGRIFSNDPAAVYLLTGYRVAYPPAVRTYYGATSTGLREQKRRFFNFMSSVASSDGAYLIWFLPHWRTILCSPDQLRDLCQIEVVTELKDGCIMRLSPKHRSPGDGSPE